MSSAPAPRPVWPLLTLRGTRSLLAALRYRLLVGSIAIAYALSAMLFAGMLYLPSAPSATPAFFYIFPSGPGPTGSYPAILAGGSYFQLDLPFLSAILMTLTAAGVGLGMALAVLLGIRLLRRRSAGLLGPTVVGSAAGFTPAMIALVTLGACCSTTAAATAGIALAAQSSGTSAAALLANTWYLGVFQVVVVYVALLAQEQLVGVYGFLFGEGTSAPIATGEARPTVSPLGWRAAGSAVLRVALIVAGLTWSLAMFAGWITTSPGNAGVWTWFGWIFQHQVPGLLAVVVGLFPARALAWWGKIRWGGWDVALRGTLVASGAALLTWMPVAASRAGASALSNELLGFWRYPASWGAVAPPAFSPAGLILRWAFQFALLGVFAISMGGSPQGSLRALFEPAVTTSGQAVASTGPRPAAAAAATPARSDS